MYAQAVIKPNTLLRNGAYGIVMMGVQKCTRGCSSLRGRKRLPLCCIKLDTATEGNDIDLSQVADWFYGLYKNFNIKLWKCGYDQRFAKDLLNRMENYGWSKANNDVVMVLQNAQTLSNAIKLLEADFKHQIVNFNENEIDKWCLGNACLKLNNLGQCLIVKSDVPSKRIDGAVCSAILYEIYRQNRTEWKQIIGGKNGMDK